MRLLCPFMVERGYFLMFKWYRIIAVLIFALALTFSSRPTQAAGTVTNCTFADLTTALAGGGVVDFNIGADCTFYFTNFVNITVNTTIQNTSAYRVIFTSQISPRVPLFHVDAVTFNVSNVTFYQGGGFSSMATYNGGAIYTAYGTLNISNSIFDGNWGGSGGAIKSYGGTVYVNNSIFRNNSAISNGGAIDASDGSTLTVTNSVFHNNSAGSGGGIYSAYGGTFSITNSTFTANTGSAVWTGGSSATIRHSTFVSNILFLEQGSSTITVSGNIFANQTCNGTHTDGGNNIAYNATGCFGANINPNLGAFSGGVFIPANRAIEYASACIVSTDQLGTSRPQGTLCTPGAVEVDPPPQSVTVQFTSASGNALESANTGAFIRVTTSDAFPVAVAGSVQIIPTGGSATNGSDYTVVSSTITIPAGTAHNATISINPNLTIINDAIDEPDETIELALTSPVEVSIGAQGTYTHTIIDDDLAGINIGNASFVISEPNGSNQFSVVLNSQPTADVTLNMSVSDPSECQISTPSITFTSGNWSTAQYVTVTAVDDLLVDSAQPCDIHFTVVSGDGLYNGLSLSDVHVTVNDDDIPDAILIINGDNQQTAINTPFANPIIVQVNDSLGQPLEGATVIFTPPASGASAILSAYSGTTDMNGQITITADANGEVGAYQVIVESGVLTPVAINLENLDPDALDVTAICVGLDLHLTINTGAPNFDITGISGADLPQLNVPLGTYVFTGPDTWVGVTISELTGDLETITLPDITCDVTVVTPPVLPVLPPPPVPDKCDIRGYSYEMPVGIFCTDLYQDGMFTIPGSVPANLQHVIDAVDVGKFNGERTISGEFERGLPICLEGVGRLFFLDGSTSPRAQSELATFNMGGRTCGFIINGGTVVLIAP
ncbi:MAG: hypothetical protein CUN52_07115 [Phototrophicales bacterium]|nr:MAG: hypothetical protein CUN52_07115 [Phototrophicales bacterium]